MSGVEPRVASEFFRKKYEREARKSWEIFYKTHGTNFFKDRHWLSPEWPAVFPRAAASSAGVGGDDADGRAEEVARGPGPSYVIEPGARRAFLEVGCGVGNTVFPMLELDPEATVFCCDFSARAIDMVKQRAATLPERDRNRVVAFVCDATCESLLENVPPGSIDVATLVFALSAMSREKMTYCVRNLSTVMREGQKGVVCVRDYAAGDLAQARFSTKDAQKLSENFYVRHDGTRAYYFTKEDLTDLFAEEGMEMQEIKVHERTITNRADAKDMNRRWIQACFASAREAPKDFVPPSREKDEQWWAKK